MRFISVDTRTILRCHLMEAEGAGMLKLIEEAISGGVADRMVMWRGR